MRYRYSAKPGGRGGRRYKRPDKITDNRESAATLPYGGRQRQSAARIENRITKWDQGTAELEATMAKQRERKHQFVPLGRLPSCEVCGAGRDETYKGKRIHHND